MAKTAAVILKNIRVRPEAAPNNGKGRVQLEALVFSTEEDARIESVVVDLSSMGGNMDERMRFVKAEGIAGTHEGLYTIAFQVPGLTDPGRHQVRQYRYRGIAQDHPTIDLLGRPPFLWGITYRFVRQFLALLSCDSGLP